MCFTDKKKELDSKRGPCPGSGSASRSGRVGYGGAAHHTIVQAKRRKRRREEIQVWNSNICKYGILVGNFSFEVWICW